MEPNTGASLCQQQNGGRTSKQIWKELEVKLVAAAKKWQTQKHRTKEVLTKAARAEGEWKCNSFLEVAKKFEMELCAQELMDALPNTDLAKLTPFLQDDARWLVDDVTRVMAASLDGYGYGYGTLSTGATNRCFWT